MLRKGVLSLGATTEKELSPEATHHISEEGERYLEQGLSQESLHIGKFMGGFIHLIPDLQLSGKKPQQLELCPEAN